MRHLTLLTTTARVLTAATLLLAAGSASLAAQARVVNTPSAVLSSPRGQTIGSVHPGVELRVLETRGSYARVSVGGWVERRRIIIPASGARPRVRERTTVIRTRARASASSVGSFDAGTLLTVPSTRVTNGWIHVSREGWVLRSTLSDPAASVARKAPASSRSTVASRKGSERRASGGEVEAPARAPTAAAAARQGPAARDTAGQASPGASSSVGSTRLAALEDSALVPTANLPLRAAPDARAVATLAPGTRLVPLARERGWVRVRVEGWVPERDLAPADTTVRSNVSAADLRADAAAAKGLLVRWSVQILATQKADGLRRDLAPDETYLLARGPADENALLYLVVPPSLMATVRDIPELTQAMITARVRTGKSQLVGVPILDLVTVTPQK